MHILSTYRETFSFTPVVMQLPEGESLVQMAYHMSLPDDFMDRGVICVNGHPVPRECWPLVKPRAGLVTEVTFHQPPRGGDDGGGKQILTMIASIALTVATGFIAGGALATKFGSTLLFAKNSISAIALAGAVSLIGSLLLSSLVPPPSVPNMGNRQNLGSASAEGNVLEPNTAIPRVVGWRKVYPPLASEPLTYFSGPDEIVEALYILAGPHKIEDIRIGAAAVSSMVDVDIEVREGWPGDPLINMIRRQARTETIQNELRPQIVSSDDGRTLETNSGDAVSALPQAQVVATRDRPDEHQIQLVMAQGLHINGSDSDYMRVPIRMRMRPVGGSWVNLPEIHFQGANIRQIRSTIRFVWGDSSYVADPSAANPEGFVEARVFSPGQTVSPQSDDWLADSYFVAPSGDQYLNISNTSSSAVKNVSMNRYTASIYLDRAVFSARRYEIEIKRGASFKKSSYNPTDYTYGGSVWDFWGSRGTPGEIVMSRNQVGDSTYLLRSVSMWNSHPLPSRDLATVAVRARNRAMDKLSFLAGGYVKDWDGADWVDWKITSNPAPHLRDIYVGAENADPVPTDLLDNDALLDWRARCIAKSYTCNALLEDQTVDESARIVAACGYAKPYMSDLWGIIQDYDRSAEAPVQLFTPRNSSGFSWTKGFARVPDGFRVNFRDSSRDYEMNQISVFRPGHTDDNGRMEQVTLEGLVVESDVVTRAVYDQNQAVYRNTFYTFDCSAESIVSRRGHLIAVQNPTFTRVSASARVVGLVESGGFVSGVDLDLAVDPGNPVDMLTSADLLTEPDLYSMCVLTGLAIRGDSVTLHQVQSVSGNRVLFDIPVADPDFGVGSLVSYGLVTQEYLRLIVFGITPRENYEATITAVDEAPQLWV